MEMDKVILVIHVLVAISLVGLILIQRSSADGGAAFGGGSQQSLLGTTGSAPLLTKVTVGLVVIFFITSLSLAYFNRHFGDNEQVIIPEATSFNESMSQEIESDMPQVTINPVDDDIPTAIENTDIPVEQN